ncbi:MAG: ATP-binding cassette domain-containing protein, partial [Pseudomonadota bacterium]
GPSGCGKSTLLRMIAGLEEISDGDVFIDGTRVNDLEPVKRGISMVFQSYALYPHMSVYENIAFPLRVEGLGREALDQKVREAARILKLEERLRHRPGQLSGGQRQRVAIGRSIVREPAVFLFDEPLSNLDAALRAEMRVELTKLHRDLDATMIYVTHDQIEALTLAQRIAVMQDHEIQQLGTPSEVYHHPANRFVAGFVGSPRMNFIEGRLDIENGDLFFVAGHQRLPLNGYGFVKPPQVGRSITLGVRPEHLIIGEHGSCRLEGLAVDMVEPMGADSLVWLGDGNVTLRARVSGEQAWERGEILPVTLPIDQLSLFSTDDGKRL